MNAVCLRPFVLRCPECSAPTESKATSCRYCKVPLVWEPSQSFMRDDAWMRTYVPPTEVVREVEDEPDMIIRPFETIAIRGGESYQFHYCPQRIFRPVMFWIDPKIAENFQLEFIQIGAKRILPEIDSPTVPGILFSRGRGMPLAETETMMPGITVWTKRKDASAVLSYFIEDFLELLTPLTATLSPLASDDDLGPRSLARRCR